MKEYKHLNLVQRSVISALKASGIKQKDIALYAECNPSTVSRELSRNKTKTGKYSPKVAQEISEERKERFRKERKFTKEMKVFVIKHISEEQWSVEQIVGYCRKNGIPIFFAILIVLGSEVLVNTLMVLCGNTYQKTLILKILQIKKLKNINIKLIIDQEKY